MSKRSLIAGATLLIAAIVLLAPDAETRMLLRPIALDLAILIAFITALYSRKTGPPVDESGAWYMAIASLYAILPVAVFIGLGKEYTIFNDNRLFALQPMPLAVANVAWFYTINLAAFAAAYLMGRGPIDSAEPGEALRVPQSMLVTAALIVIPVTLVGLIAARGGTYSQTYLAAAARPLLERQAIKFFTGASTVGLIAMLAAMFSRYRRYRILIWAWPFFELIVSLLNPGSRTPLMISLASCVLLYHTVVRPVRGKMVVAGGLVAVTLFLGLGAYRTWRGWEAEGLAGVPGGGGEFESVFGTSMDLYNRRINGALTDVPPIAPVADILAIVPSQVLPLEKVDLSEWYVDHYPLAKERGTGYAFGVVAQSMIGYGWIEAAIRGLILGYLFARLHSFYRRRRDRPWIVIGYVWLCVLSYQSFRSSSFALFPAFVQLFLPGMILIEGMRHLLAHASKMGRYSGDEIAAVSGDLSIAGYQRTPHV